ncbi:MAG: tRNA (adenosine(37)-N6)-threonylcarbamoyltransferase complex dimerization subunit type 1 TsaB, partial [Blastocatellia bacterium]
MGSFILAIDTASRSGSIAAARDGRLVAVWGVDTGARQSSVLWEDIEIMLSRLEASIDDVSAIAVARGPGAFTGLRIG